jgi:hypothetical protein
LSTQESETIKIQTQELSNAVVQTLLEDSSVASLATQFLHEATVAPATQEALYSLLMRILAHPQSTEEFSAVASDLVLELAADAQVVAAFGQLLGAAAQESIFLESVQDLFIRLGQDASAGPSLQALCRNILTSPHFTQVSPFC